jgi:DUF1365 family protein
MWQEARLLVGEVMHRRVSPVAHGFRYPVFACLLPMGRLASAVRPVFSLERWNLLSWHRRDHGRRDGSDPLAWLREKLAASGVTADGEVWLQTFPRVFGFVFNPVSFWYCFDRAGKLRAVLAEVSNTFGERHAYLLAHPDGRPIAAGDEFRCAKVFHVSPFFPVDGRYRFRFVLAEDRLRVFIAYGGVEGERLYATIAGTLAGWSTGALLAALARHGWMTAMVVWRIHWQAARLYFGRRLRYFRKPLPPAADLSRSANI